MRVLIIGAGKTGIHLAEKLHDDHEVTIIDQRAERVEMVAAMFPSVTAVLGDACDPMILERANVAEADSVVAATGDDEDNLVVAMLAKHYGGGAVYARVNHPRNEWLFDSEWGVDVAVSAADVFYGLVEKDLGVGDLVTLLNLRGEGITLDEITLPANATAVGRTLADVSLPGNASVVAILSATGSARVARGDTPIEAGDQVLLLVEGTTEPGAIATAFGIDPDQGAGTAPVTDA